jgi:WLM domain
MGSLSLAKQQSVSVWRIVSPNNGADEVPSLRTSEYHLVIKDDVILSPSIRIVQYVLQAQVFFVNQQTLSHTCRLFSRHISAMKIQYRDELLEFVDVEDETVSQLATRCAQRIDAEESRITLLFMPKPGLVKHPFPHHKLSEVVTHKTKVKLVGTPSSEVTKLEAMGAAWCTSSRPSGVKPVAANKYRDWRKVQEEARYTFHAIEPLPYLPEPEKSRRFLERLANDPGIKASMRKHRFSVGLLTEMNPVEHTTHESRTLGLNRNRGEVIELRLRTDRYVWGDHDANFWALTKEIEWETERNDFLHGGNLLSNEEFYHPGDSMHDADHVDGGGWLGGDFVLGRSKDAQSEEGLSRREIMARAALSRQQKQDEAKKAQNEQRDI